MQLSTAMMLGSTTCRMKWGDIQTCAIGAALNALGEPKKHRYERAVEVWPWLDAPSPHDTDHLMDIYSKFDGPVCRGEMTFEQLVDYVRSIEPSCGECNRFICACVKAEEVCEVVAYV
jgi:hypothetical protein